MKHKFDNIWCEIKEWKHFPDKIRKYVCVYCGEFLEYGEDIALLFNNREFFPHTIIHKNCLDELGGYESCIKTLQERYKKHQKLLKEAEALWHEVKEEE